MYIFADSTTRAGCDTRSFLAEFNGFAFSFLSSWPDTKSKSRTQFVRLFTYSWRENSCMHTFFNGISVMWNAKEPCPNFEPKSPNPMITITSWTPSLSLSLSLLYIYIYVCEGKKLTSHNKKESILSILFFPLSLSHFNRRETIYLVWRFPGCT